MSVKIRLARGGRKKKPFYRIVVANITAPRDGDFLEIVGTYDPTLAKDNANRISLNAERAKHWLSVGAQPTERVEKFLVNAGLCKAKKRTLTPKPPKKKSA